MSPDQEGAGEILVGDSMTFVVRPRSWWRRAWAWWWRRLGEPSPQVFVVTDVVAGSMTWGEGEAQADARAEARAFGQAVMTEAVRLAALTAEPGTTREEFWEQLARAFAVAALQALPDRTGWQDEMLRQALAS